MVGDPGEAEIARTHGGKRRINAICMIQSTFTNRPNMNVVTGPFHSLIT